MRVVAHQACHQRNRRGRGPGLGRTRRRVRHGLGEPFPVEAAEELGQPAVRVLGSLKQCRSGLLRFFHETVAHQTGRSHEPGRSGGDHQPVRMVGVFDPERAQIVVAALQVRSMEPWPICSTGILATDSIRRRCCGDKSPGAGRTNGAAGPGNTAGEQRPVEFLRFRRQRLQQLAVDGEVPAGQDARVLEEDPVREFGLDVTIRQRDAEGGTFHLVSVEIGNERVTDEPRRHLDTGVATVHTPFGRINSHQLLPQAPRSSESRQEPRRNFAQFISSPQPHRMNRYWTNHGCQAKPERRPT